MSTVGSAAPDELADDTVPDQHSTLSVPLRSTAPPASVLENAGELLRALASPVRIAIVLQLHQGARCVHELVEALDVTQPLVSQHLRILKAADLVQGQRRGREVVYTLIDDHLAHIVIDAVAHAQENS